MLPIYLDYNATTPLDPAVVAAMLPFLQEHFGNPSSDHAYGRTARAAVQNARAQLASLLGAQPEQVILTGGGSEANNLAIKGITSSYRQRGRHLITTAVEHPSVLNVFRYLERQGFQITVVPVDHSGQVDLAALAAALTDQTILVSVMHANNEVGTIQPLRAVAEVVQRHGALLHTDAAQTVGKIPVDITELGVDLLTVAGHKLYAPKGVGALVVREGIRLEPVIHGAGHEGGLRAGTENVASIVGLGQAAALAQERLPVYGEQTRVLRDLLQQEIQRAVPGARLNGHPTERLPNTLNLGFPGIDAAALLGLIREHVACSTGSACHAGHAAPSEVLLAMGQDPARAASALRLSLGWQTTEQEVRQAAAVIADATHKVA